MAITFRYSCGRIIAADNKYAGLKVRCPDCKVPIRVPESEIEVLPAPEIQLPSFGSAQRDARAIRKGRFDPTACKPGGPTGSSPIPLRRLRKAAGKSYRWQHRRRV